MCAQQLEVQPNDVDALALMSRLCLLAGDVAAAIACASAAVRIGPNHPQGRAALESALAQRPNPHLAAQRLQEAIDLEPDVAAYNVCYGSAGPFAAIERARELLEEALRLDPGLAPAHAALANVLARQNQTLLAIPAYRRALDIDPQQPDAALALSELLYDIGEDAASERWRSQALAHKQLYPGGPHSQDARQHVLVLNAPAPWAQNTPLEFMVDPHAAALHRLYLTGDPLPPLPAHDVVFNAIGEAERAHDAVSLAAQFISTHNTRVINQPANLWKTARPHLAGALSGLRGCIVPRTQRIDRARLSTGPKFPILVRPIDTHAGRGLERIDDSAALDAYLAAHEEERFDAVPFIDYRSADGFYRKYRVVIVDGKPYPYHLALSPEWMVHYIKTPTASVDWMRAEEERFLREPAGVFPAWGSVFTEMAAALELEYFGVDCALAPDGNVLVFEADTAMLVHCREPADSYKHQYVPRIFRAVEALIAKR